MTRRASTGARHRVPYLTERAIEEHADLLLAEWTAKGHEVAVPVPLDDLVELHLQLTYEVEDLRARFSTGDVLGAIWFNENVIRIDSSLDPHDHPAMLGRFNFTLAHEIVQVPGPACHEVIQAFLLHRLNEPLRERIEIG